MEDRILKVYDEVELNVLSKEEGLELIRKYKEENDVNALDEIVRRNFNTMYSIVRKIGKKNPTDEKFDDYFQVTTIGYIKGLKKFDPNLGLSLNTYCYECACHELFRYMQEGEFPIRITHHVHGYIHKINKARKEIEEKTGRQAELNELCEATGLSEYRLKLCIDTEKLKYVSSTDEKITCQKDARELTSVLDMVPSEHDIEEEVLNKIMIKKMFELLDNREKQCIILYYYKDLTQVQIAEVLNLSQVQISRIMKKAMNKMKAYGGSMNELRNKTY